jgi:hypothetical protein
MTAEGVFAAADGGEDHLLFVQPSQDQVIILGRVSDHPEPQFLVVAQSRCIKCNQWCWLGPDSLRLVSAGEAMPVCQVCGTSVVTPENQIGMINEYGEQGR